MLKLICKYYILLIALVNLANATHAQKKQYFYIFNPIKGMVNDAEKPFRKELCLNGKWQFMPVYDTTISSFKHPKEFKWEKTPLKIPSPWNVNDFATDDGGDFVTYPSYPEKWTKAKIGWMKKTFSLPKDWQQTKIKLHFEAIAGYAQIFLNRKLVGKNMDIYFPFEIDVTQYLKEGENELIVGIAKASLTDKKGKYGRRNYVAGSFWGQHIAGIWQDVYLLSLPNVYIENVFVQPDVANNELRFEVTVKNNTEKEKKITLEALIKEWNKTPINDINEAPVQNGKLCSEVFFVSDKNIIIPSNSSKIIILKKTISQELKFWTPENPNLYGLIISIKQKSKKTLDKKYERFGWRQFIIDGTQLKLNGKPIVLKGDSWHFMGIPQMTRRYAYGWYKMLKDANANAVRLHAMPFPEFYLDVADEMGICVLDETAIWSSDGGPKMDSEEYWASCKTHVKKMVLRDRNHASVFGWSVCNETLPVAIHVFHAPEEIVQRQVDEINNWVEIVEELDPTRTWISGDGETMRKTNLPTVIGHYGDENSMKYWSSQGLPWGVGETGMAYYGTPSHVSKINAGRAYESMLGRMEGLGIEGYDLIKKQLKHKASYASLFNLIWYGLKPLELGMADISRPPMTEDGIFFPDFIEGMPGVQPERIGPYTTTINPGYDKDLPLYIAWPLFHAVKAANGGEKFDLVSESLDKSFPKGYDDVPEKREVLFFSEKKDNNDILKKIESIGIELVKTTNKPANSLLIIDGIYPTKDEKEITLVKSMAKQGAIVYIWGVSEKSQNIINNILPEKIELTNRKATSFLPKKADPILAGLDIPSFYFTEISKQPVIVHGLSGNFIKNAEKLVEACNTDWARWNHRPEFLKTAAVLRSERESKESGVAIAKYALGKGYIYVNAMDLHLVGEESNGILKQLLANLGASFLLKKGQSKVAIDHKGYLKQAMVCGRFSAEGKNLEEMATHEFINESQIKPNLNSRSQGKFWELKQANEEKLFDLKNIGLTGADRNAVAFFSFWVYSPRSLVNLLAEPDMPRLDMLIGADDGFRVYLNGEALYDDIEPGGLKADEYKYERIPLDKGWNHFLIKATQLGGEWKYMMRFECNQPLFMKKLKFNIEK